MKSWFHRFPPSLAYGLRPPLTAVPQQGERLHAKQSGQEHIYGTAGEHGEGLGVGGRLAGVAVVEEDVDLARTFGQFADLLFMERDLFFAAGDRVGKDLRDGGFLLLFLQQAGRSLPGGVSPSPDSPMNSAGARRNIKYCKKP